MDKAVILNNQFKLQSGATLLTVDDKVLHNSMDKAEILNNQFIYSLYK